MNDEILTVLSQLQAEYSRLDAKGRANGSLESYELGYTAGIKAAIEIIEKQLEEEQDV